MKLIAMLTNSNYQIFLLIVAIIIETAVAILIYKYSPRPWLSYLVWNCVGFYIFGFSAVKQSLSMAFVVFAMICITFSIIFTEIITKQCSGTDKFPIPTRVPWRKHAVYKSTARYARRQNRLCGNYGYHMCLKSNNTFLNTSSVALTLH